MATAHKMSTTHKATQRRTSARSSRQPARRPAARKPGPDHSNAMNWRQITAAVKSKWGSITADELKFVDRSMDALINKVCQRTGLDRDTAERQLDELIGALTLLPHEVVRSDVSQLKH